MRNESSAYDPSSSFAPVGIRTDAVVEDGSVATASSSWRVNGSRRSSGIHEPDHLFYLGNGSMPDAGPTFTSST